MYRPIETTWRAGLLVAALWCLPAAAGELRPIDEPWAEPNAPKIEWRGTWQETHQANVERWQKELEANVPDATLRARRLAARRVHLLQALIARHEPAADGRIAAWEEVIALLDQLGLDQRANTCRRRLVEAFPGRLEQAARWLAGMLGDPGRPEAAPWIDYAAERLLALNEAGVLPDGHPSVIEALRRRMDLRLARMQLADARSDWQELRGRLGPETPWLRLREGRLLYRVGRPAEALRIFDELRAAESVRVDSDDYRHAAEAAQEALEPVFPRRMGLEMRWAAFQAHPAGRGPEATDELLAALTREQSLLDRRDRRHVSMWRAVVNFLRAQPPGTLALLRRRQDETAREMLAEAPGEEDPGRAAAVLRRCPFAASAHEAVLAAGERLLRKGHAGLARRLFEDVLACSSDAARRARGRTGLWLAIAQQPGGRDELKQAFRNVKPDAVCPWMGGTDSAGAIRRQLLDSLPPEPAAPSGAPLAELRQRALPLPAARPWAPGQLWDVPGDLLSHLAGVHGTLVPCEGGLLLAGPNLLAFYPSGGAEPAWTRTSRLACDWAGGFRRGSDSELVVPGPMRPAVRDGVVYARWGADRRTARPGPPAAFALSTGRMLWSSADRPVWRDLQPASDPTIADGRAYLLAAKAGVHVNTALHLVCLDAADGRTLWRRLLGHQTLPLRPDRRDVFGDRRLNLTHYGSALTARAGSVYVSTCAGFVARCDARDGRIDWARSYRRAAAAQGLPEVARRQGAAPLVRDGLVVFLPRDRRGAFALVAQSGVLAWDNPYLPSDHAAELPGGRLLLNDAHHLCAADPRTGRTLWMRRLDEPVLGEPVVVGEAIYAAGPSRLRRLGADSGVVLERTPWRHGTFHTFAVTDRVVRGVGVRSAEHLATPGRTATEPRRQEPALRLPLAKRWHLARANPTVCLPPPGQPDGNRVCVLSAGVLECIEVGPAPVLRWRSLIRPGCRHLAWRDGLLIALYRDAVEAYGAADGRLRWRHVPPEPIRRHRFLGPYLVLLEGRQAECVAVLDAAAGTCRWRRRFPVGLTRRDRPGVGTLAWDGRKLYVHVKPTYSYSRARHRVLVCRPGDGQCLRTVLLPEDLHAKRPCVHVAGGSALYFGKDAKIHELPLDGARAPMTYDRELPNTDVYGEWYITGIEAAGAWVHATFRRSSSGVDGKSYVFRRGEAACVAERLGLSTLKDDRLFQGYNDAFTTTDLPARKEVSFRLPDVYRGRAEVVALKQVGEAIWSVAFAMDEGRSPARLRLDAFDCRTGEHLRTQWADVRFWDEAGSSRRRYRAAKLNPRVAWTGSAMLLAGPFGLDAYRRQDPNATAAPSPARVMQPAPRPVVLDGELDEWDANSTCEMTGEPATAARLLVSHDRDWLYLAATVRDADAAPRLGRGAYAGGDSLEIGLETPTRRLRLLVARDENAHVRVEPFHSPDEVEGARAAVRHDPVRRQSRYELALPLARIVDRYRSDDWRRMRLSATLWDERPGSGPTAVARFGAGLDGCRMDRRRHEPIYLGRLLRRHEEAALAIASASLGLPESMAFLRAYCRSRHRGPGEPGEAFAKLLRDHARTPMALKLMSLLDQAMRERVDDDPSRRVAACARAAGVPEETTRRYLRLAKTYLSLWARITAAQRQQMVMARLHDGREGDAGWNHRVFWGTGRTQEGRLGTPERQRARPHVGPKDQWLELRAPLIWIDMHDKPIHGLSLLLWGHGWLDRAALVRDGRELVLVDDAFPPGKVSGGLTWVDAPVKSGSKALAKTGSPYRAYTQDALFAQPVTFHLDPGAPAAAPIDPARAVAALRRHVPRLSGSEWGRRFFEALLRLDGGDDVPRRLALYRWYLKANPASPRAVDLLYRIQRCYQELEDPNWSGRMDDVIDECALGPETAYTYRTRYVHTDKQYLHNWQVIGPLPVVPGREGQGHELEREPIDPARACRAGERTLRWRLHKSPSGCIDMEETFPDAGAAFGYAACWVHSEKDQRVVLELGVDDYAKVWVNRRAALAHRSTSAYPRQARGDVTLHAGWNEVLVRCRNVKGKWRFYLELIRPDGRGAPGGIRPATAPPKTD